jgi:hypothetical protein
MNMPGFTAETALYKTNGYYTAIESNSASRSVYPALSIIPRPCVKYKCFPYIDIFGHATVKCEWIWVC